MLRKILFSFIGTVLIIVSANAQVTVVKQAQDVNPKLYFAGISGNSTFSSYIKSDLQKCGWFEITSNSNEAKYKITGKDLGNKLTISVSGADSFSLSMDKSKASLRMISFKIVDTILNRIFRIPGICSSKIVFVAKNKNGSEYFLYTCNFDGSDLTPIVKNNNILAEPTWGYNNGLIAYTYYHANYMDIAAYILNSKKTQIVSRYPGQNSSAAVSPNNKYMAVVLSKDKQVDLYVKELFGNKKTRITADDAVEGTPTWSPDGKNLCYVTDKYLGRRRLYIYNLSSKKSQRVPIIGSIAQTPDWSPLGDKIVYSALMGKNYVLGVYDIRKGESKTVNTNAAGDWLSPSWAPDGRHVVCTRRLNYQSQLYIVDTWTGKSRQLFKSGMNLSSPSWSELF